MKKILVIDDDRFNRTFVRDALEKAGYAVIESEDGEQGIEKAGREAPDLILLDIVMPGLDGIDVCHRLKALESCKNTPIVMYTSLDEDRLIEIALKAGASDYIIKPPSVTQLRIRVALNLRLAEALAEIARLKGAKIDDVELIDLVENA